MECNSRAKTLTLRMECNSRAKTLNTENGAQKDLRLSVISVEIPFRSDRATSIPSQTTEEQTAGNAITCYHHPYLLGFEDEVKFHITMENPNHNDTMTALPLFTLNHKITLTDDTMECCYSVEYRPHNRSLITDFVLTMEVGEDKKGLLLLIRAHDGARLHQQDMSAIFQEYGRVLWRGNTVSRSSSRRQYPATYWVDYPDVGFHHWDKRSPNPQKSEAEQNKNIKSFMKNNIHLATTFQKRGGGHGTQCISPQLTKWEGDSKGKKCWAFLSMLYLDASRTSTSTENAVAVINTLAFPPGTRWARYCQCPYDFCNHQSRKDSRPLLLFVTTVATLWLNWNYK
ncbi:unnamed protein product [Cyprideis torosa]|uniref:Uncharacterized protein n=1 Tax=Cyprideis torosa TaxID=163714 RepID=A0A7R8ZJA2_9CRUS|nr:unnamed protein product [Cyprideis torosa]CAG0886437.1 unnamed protein product [Cyprideis torosa]